MRILLGALNIKADEYGKEEAFTKLTPSQVIDKIVEHGGLSILAHANSSHGVMNDMKGNPRIEIIQNINLIAVEATDFDNTTKKKKRKRVIDLLDGKDPNYKRKLAVYQVSDSHNLNTIGSKYTYFKLDEISLEGLRLCFCDSDVRIKQKDELKPSKFPKIIHLEVTKGFFNNQKIPFHEGLNSIVGGKGVGKSLIIEFLRFSLDQSSKIESILKDHHDKLEKRLGSLGKLILEFILTSGERYRITRSFDGIDNAIECLNLITNEPYEGELAGLFPVLAYSQNEVIKIAEDEQAQLRLVDSFIESSMYIKKIKDLSSEITKKDLELAKSIKASSAVASFKIDLSTTKEQIKNINRSLKNKLFDEMRIWENKNTAIEKQLDFHQELTEMIESKIASFSSELVIPSVDNGFENDPQLKKARNLSEQSYNSLIELMNMAKEKVRNNEIQIRESYESWVQKFKKKQATYEKMLVDAGGDKSKLEGIRRKLEEEKKNIEKKIEKHNKQLEKLDEIKKIRDLLLDELEKIYGEYYNARKRKFDDLTRQSNGKLLLELNHSTNRTKFKIELLALCKGSWIRDADIEKVTQKLMPREFVDLVINNEVCNLAERAELAGENAERLINVLNSKEDLEEVLGLAHKSYPEDIPAIKFRKEDGVYNPLSELSVGQKCTALLIIALSEGECPIIIDQPEDSLDNPSIYKDVVAKLRSGKEKRQFILTTHNSSVGVASDSDNFIILKSTANQGSISCCGAIDRKSVHNEIVDHLEGGEKPYSIKNKKYNL